MTAEAHRKDEAAARMAYRHGVAALRAGRPHDAVPLLARSRSETSDPVLRLRAAEAMAAACRRAGDLPGAAEAYGQVAAARPTSAQAWLNLGAARADGGDLSGAADALRRAVSLGAGDPQPRRALARVLNDLGRSGEAQAVCEAGLEEQPDDPGLQRSLARAFQLQGRADLCAAVLRRALAASPADGDLLLNLASALGEDGRTDEALELLRTRVAERPDDAAARLALCMAHLPPTYSDDAEMERRRADYACELDGLATWAATRPALLADAVGLRQPYQLPYQGRCDRELQQRYGRTISRAMRSVVATPAPAALPGAGEKVRVGFVSGFFREHSNWRMPMEGWVRGMDRERFRLFGYHTGGATDPVTAEAARQFERFVQGPLSTAAWCAEIGRDAPHVLIYPEIGMDPAAVRLAALRLAPLQCNGWGHPVTSGLPTLDLFLSSDAMEPSDAQGAYSERLIRLPGLSTTLFPSRITPTLATRSELGLPEGRVVVWCGHSPSKHLPSHLDVLANIAARAPDAAFAFLAFPGGDRLTRAFTTRLRAAFERASAGAGDRVVMLPRMSPERFSAALASCDVVLDSLDWSGCNTNVAAIEAARPIVTAPGRFMRGRHGAALLDAVGLGDWVRPDVEGYADLAVDLATDAPLRARFARETEARRERLHHANDSALRELERVLIDALEALRSSTDAPVGEVERAPPPGPSETSADPAG